MTHFSRIAWSYHRPATRHILSAALAATALSACGGDKPKAAATEPIRTTVAMTVGGSGSGSGRVMSIPAGINCGLAAGAVTGNCTARFEPGTVVTLTTEPGASSVFLAFAGDCTTLSCQTTMEAPRTVIATFVPNYLSVVANAASVGGGRIISEPAGIDCILNGTAPGQGACSTSFPLGTAVTLTQEPVAGAMLQAWSSVCTGNPCTVTMNGQRTVDVTYRVSTPPAPQPPPQTPQPPQATTATLTVTPSTMSRGSGMITSVPSGISCSVSGGSTSGVCSVAFPLNTAVALTQVASGSTIFQSWGGDCTGNPCQVTLERSRAAEVMYRIPASGMVTVSGSGTGLGSVASAPAGISCTVSAGVASGICTAAFDAGTAVTLVASGSNNGSFDGFAGGCVGSACTITAISGVTTAVTAGFTAAPQRLTVAPGSGSAGSGLVTSTPAGINCVLNGSTSSGNCTGFFAAGTLVTLNQSSSGNAVFREWAGDCTGDPCQVVMSQSRTALAVFQTQGVTVSAGGTGSGTVTSVPSGISCTVTAGIINGSCATTFPANTVVTLTATPTGLSSFTGYSGTCTGSGCVLTTTVGTTSSVLVQFAAPPTLTVTPATGSDGGGTISSSPAGVSCTLSNAARSGSCATAFALNSAVTLTQTPTNGSVFLNWAGACSGSGNCQVSMSQSRSIQALYRVAVPGSLTINAGAGSGNGTVSSQPGGVACTITNRVKTGICRAIFPVGSTVRLIATPGSGFTFAGFGGNCSGQTCTLIVPENGDLTVEANFTP
jgi:Divergent InlB B-repeat domain